MDKVVERWVTTSKPLESRGLWKRFVQERNQVLPQPKPSKSISDKYQDYLKAESYLEPKSQMFVRDEMGFDEGGLATPKRGLVDGPGSYSQKTGFAINPEGRLKGTKVAKEILDAKKVKTVGHVKELEKWIEANASKYTDVDKFYQDAIKKFDKPKYEGLVRESVQQAKKNVRNPIKAGKHIYLPATRSVYEGQGKTPKAGRYNYKNLFELRGADAGSKIRYVKDMMLINMLEKNPKLEKFATNLDKVMLNDTVGMSSNDIAEVKAFTRKNLKATAARPNLFRSYLTNKHKGFEDLRKERIKISQGVYSNLQNKLNDPNLSDAAKQKVKRTLANMDKSRKYHIQFKNEFPDLFADKKVYDPLGAGRYEETFDFEHKIGKGTIGVNKLPETYYLRGTYVPASFNLAKLKDFDRPLLSLMNEYRETKNPKIEKQIKDLYKTFNKKSDGYLNDLTINFDRSTGSVIIDDKTPIYKVKDYNDYKQMMSKNLKHSQAYLKNFKKGKYAFADKKLKNLLTDLCPNKAQGGRIGMKVAGTPGVACGANRFKQVFKNPAKGTQAERQLVGQIVKRGGSAAGRKALYALGPAGAGIDALIEGAIWGDEVLKGSSGAQAYKNHWLSYLDPTSYTGGLKVSGDRYNETEIAKKYKGDTAKFFNLRHAIEDKYRLENKLKINEESDVEGYGVTLSPSQQLRLEAVNTIINNHGGEERVLGLIKEDSPLYDAARISSEKFEEVGPGKQWDASWLSGTREPGTPGQRLRDERRKREMDLYPTYDMFITPSEYKAMDLEQQREAKNVIPQASLTERANIKESYEIPSTDDLSQIYWKDTGMSLLDEYNLGKKWNYLINQRGMTGTQDRFAGGGIAGVRRPHAIPPKSGPMPQGGGLSSMFNRVRKW